MPKKPYPPTRQNSLELLPLLSVLCSAVGAPQACTPYVTCEDLPACYEHLGGAGGDGTGGGTSSGGASGWEAQDGSDSGGTGRGTGGTETDGSSSSSASGGIPMTGGRDGEPESGGNSGESGGAGGLATGGGDSGGSGGGDTGGSTSGGAESGGTGGVSSPMDPSECSQDGECIISGECRISFRDEDGDGYGTSSDTTGRCDGSVPSGFALFEGDCCDNGGDLALAAEINPAQEGYFDAPANICGIDWDYDCSGDLSSNADVDTGCQQFTGAICSDDEHICQGQSRKATEEDCGSIKAQITCFCKGVGVGDATCDQHSTMGPLIKCR